MVAGSVLGDLPGRGSGVARSQRRCGTRRFTARLSGLAFGLALAVSPAPFLCPAGGARSSCQPARRASITTILDLYGHLYPGEMDRHADRLNEAAGMTDAADDAAR